MRQPALVPSATHTVRPFSHLSQAKSHNSAFGCAYGCGDRIGGNACQPFVVVARLLPCPTTRVGRHAPDAGPEP